MMTTYSSDNEFTPSTPIYEQTVGSTADTEWDGSDDLFVAASSEAQPSEAQSSDQPSSGLADKASTAQDDAKNVASDAKDATQQVAGVAKEQVKQVANEAKGQARQLLGQASSEVREQAAEQQKRVASGLRDVSYELDNMAQASSGGLATELVQNLSDRADTVANWLESRDPGSLVGELRTYAARKPGTFIAIAAGAGILAGRLAKSLATAASDENGSGSAASNSAPSTPAASTPAAPSTNNDGGYVGDGTFEPATTNPLGTGL